MLIKMLLLLSISSSFFYVGMGKNMCVFRMFECVCVCVNLLLCLSKFFREISIKRIDRGWKMNRQMTPTENVNNILGTDA